MQSDTRLGTFDDVLAKSSDDSIKTIAAFLRELIIKLDPDTFEVPRPGEKAASYGVGPKKISEGYAYIMVLKDSVNLGFYKGTSLKDPNGLLDGTGAALRHVKIRSLAEAKKTEITALLKEAVKERKTSLKK